MLHERSFLVKCFWSITLFVLECNAVVRCSAADSQLNFISYCAEYSACPCWQPIAAGSVLECNVGSAPARATHSSLACASICALFRKPQVLDPAIEHQLVHQLLHQKHQLMHQIAQQQVQQPAHLVLLQLAHQPTHQLYGIRNNKHQS